jgi:toxin CcdB
MAQFDVHRGRLDNSLLLDCQSDLLDVIGTRFVIPLLPTGVAQQTNRLHPIVEISGERMLVSTHLASAVSCDELGPVVASLADQRYEILNALDMLITGI